jgi:heptosyltransferase I
MQSQSVGAPPGSICLVRLSAIGDTCHALAVVRNLQDNWPDTKLTWIIGRTEAGLLGDVAGVEFIIFDKRQGRSAYRGIQHELEGRQFDIALCMHASLRVNFLYPRLPAATRLGFDRGRARDFQWLFTNERIEARDHEHALDAMLGFARYLGARPTPVRWDIPLPQEARDYAARHLDTNTVILSPVSTQRARNYRNWPVDRYRAVCEHLVANHGCRVVVTGAGSQLERDYARALAELGGVTSIVGETSLKELVAIFAGARLVICPDSGPAHMATAVGTPVIGLYATSNPLRTGPYLYPELTVNRYPDAVARYLGKPVEALRWGQRVRHPDAMKLIEIDDVTCKIDEFMRI